MFNHNIFPDIGFYDFNQFPDCNKMCLSVAFYLVELLVFK